MQIVVYDQDRDAVGVIDKYISFIWTDKFDTYGDFELKVEPSSEILNLLSFGNYLSISESDTWMVVEDLTITTEDDGSDEFTFTGRSILSLFEYRTENYQLNNFGYGDSADLDANDILSDLHAVAFDNIWYSTTKNIDYILYEPSTDSRIDGVDITFTLGWRAFSPEITCLERLDDVVRIYGIGVKMYVDSDKNFILTPYLGEDRTRDNVNNNSYVIFSPEFNNLESSEWFYSNRSFKNIIYIHSSNSPQPVVRYRTFEYEPVGIERREGILDGSYISKYNGSSEKTSGDLYDEMLDEAYYHRDTETIPTNFFTGKAINNTFYYGEDYFLGDIVEFENKYGLTGQAMLTEITFSVDESGIDIYPTFDFIN